MVLDHAVDDLVLLRLLRAHEVVPLGVLGDLVERLAGVLGDDLVEALADVDDLLGVDLDVRGLSGEAAETWWIRIFEFGNAIRLSGAPPASSRAPMLIATPTQMVDTSGLMNCIAS